MEGKEASPGEVHASTWASAGLGVALGGFGRRGGLGSLVVSLVGAWGACGGRGERRRDGVRVFSAHGQLDIHEAPRSNQIETRGAFCGFRSMRAASESDSCHSPIPRDEFWVPKSPRSAIPDVSFSHHVTQPPLRFSRGTTSANARRPTRRGSALDRSALSDFKATHQEILASNNLQGKRRTIST